MTRTKDIAIMYYSDDDYSVYLKTLNEQWIRVEEEDEWQEDLETNFKNE